MKNLYRHCYFDDGAGVWWDLSRLFNLWISLVSYYYTEREHESMFAKKIRFYWFFSLLWLILLFRRLRTRKNCDGKIELFVRCDMSSVAELWAVQAEITLKGTDGVRQ